jgi:hypothetical protein
MTTARIISGADYVAASLRSGNSYLNCFCCGEPIDCDKDADRNYARVANGGRLFCSGDCANWCARFHDSAAHLGSGEGEQVSYWI